MRLHTILLSSNTLKPSSLSCAACADPSMSFSKSVRWICTVSSITRLEDCVLPLLVRMVLCQLFNWSHEYGSVLSKLKYAYIVPLLKKADLVTADVESYHSISNLSIKYIAPWRPKTQRHEDRELNQAMSKPNKVNQPVSTVHIILHHYMVHFTVAQKQFS